MLPKLLGFQKNKVTKSLFGTLGGLALTYTVFTKAKWGVVKVLPFKGHLAINLSIDCFSVAASWLLGFESDPKARNICVIAGTLGLGLPY
jgi:hypothetical protein